VSKNIILVLFFFLLLLESCYLSTVTQNSNECVKKMWRIYETDKSSVTTSSAVFSSYGFSISISIQSPNMYWTYLARNMLYNDAPVLERPAPLGCLHDSGAGYKYPDLLTYLLTYNHSTIISASCNLEHAAHITFELLCTNFHVVLLICLELMRNTSHLLQSKLEPFPTLNW